MIDPIIEVLKESDLSLQQKLDFCYKYIEFMHQGVITKNEVIGIQERRINKLQAVGSVRKDMIEKLQSEGG